MTFLETNIDELVSVNHPYRKILEIIIVRDALKRQGLIREVFTFVDATPELFLKTT